MRVKIKKIKNQLKRIQFLKKPIEILKILYLDPRIISLLFSFISLLVLLSVDLIFIITSFLHYFTDLSLKNFLVDAEGSYPEKFQYLKFIGISIMCFLIWIKRKTFAYIVFMIIPIYLFWDDSKVLHEKLGGKIAVFIAKNNYQNTLFINFRYQDIGEIIYMLSIAFILLTIFCVSFKLSNKSDKYFLKKSLKLFFIYGFFAIFVDLIHQFTWGKINNFIGIIEDGGEMIPISFIFASFFHNLQRNKNNLKLSKTNF